MFSGLLLFSGSVIATNKAACNQRARNMIPSIVKRPTIIATMIRIVLRRPLVDWMVGTKARIKIVMIMPRMMAGTIGINWTVIQLNSFWR